MAMILFLTVSHRDARLLPDPRSLPSWRRECWRRQRLRPMRGRV